MSWCEGNGVDYVFGLAKNSRLIAELVAELALAEARSKRRGRPARVFKDFRYQTLKTWSCERRVVGKAEHNAEGSNPRFIVTTLGRLGCHGWSARRLYEDLYCARGEMENRIKEQQLCLFADRTSTSALRANQIRLWFSSLAYTLMNTLRREGLRDTEMARARCDTIRLKLLKIGAAVRVSARRIWIAMSSSFPLKDLFVKIWRRLEELPRQPACVPQRC